MKYNSLYFAKNRNISIFKSENKDFLINTIDMINQYFNIYSTNLFKY